MEPKVKKRRIEITEPNIKVLRAIKGTGAGRAGMIDKQRIAEITETSFASASAQVRRLEAKKFIDRKQSKDGIVFKLSPLGRRALDMWNVLF